MGVIATSLQALGVGADEPFPAVDVLAAAVFAGIALPANPAVAASVVTAASLYAEVALTDKLQAAVEVVAAPYAPVLVTDLGALRVGAVLIGPTSLDAFGPLADSAPATLFVVTAAHGSGVFVFPRRVVRGVGLRSDVHACIGAGDRRSDLDSVGARREDRERA
jgi:hypothetical protein